MISNFENAGLEHFEPYFLNTYLTHTLATATNIVDGQQRLTTLLLILIKLYRILQEVDANPELRGKTFTSGALRPLIFEQDDFGGAARSKIFNPNREKQLRALVEGADFTPEDETQKRLKENYGIIDAYFDLYFCSLPETCELDLVKLTYYITYLLDRVSSAATSKSGSTTASTGRSANKSPQNCQSASSRAGCLASTQ